MIVYHPLRLLLDVRVRKAKVSRFLVDAVVKQRLCLGAREKLLESFLVMLVLVVRNA